jgi:predicted NBD/HSP70 family sugar kinase
MQDLPLLSSSPRRVRQSNEVAALRALHRFGRLSRADLARKLQLNRSSSGHIIAGLTEDGLVREVRQDEAGRPGNGRAGRPGILLQLVPDAIFFLGVEIGVEHISVVEIDLEAKVVSTSVEPLDGPPADIEATVERAVSQAFQSIPRERWHRCEGVGVSAPAQVDKTGFVRLAPLLGWRSLYPAEMVRNALPVAVPVVAENDANAFAIGATYGRQEALAGVTLFVVLETGVGGGIIVDGTLLRGAHGLAGEIGHMRGAGGAAGCPLERIIGLEGLIARYRAVLGDPEAGFARFVSDVRDRVPSAVEIAEEWAKELAFGIAQVCRVVDPDRIMLGGSVAALYPLVAARVAFHLTQVQGEGFPRPEITVNEYAAYGSAFGAACMLHRRYLSLESQRYAEADVPSDGNDG